MPESIDVKPYLSLIIPAYNEQDRIVSSLADVRVYLSSLDKPYEIIVVDDGSSDDTTRVVNEQAAGDDRVKVITHTPNRGKGYAVRLGMLASQGEYAAFSDADLSTPIEELQKLFTAMEHGSDIAIGSRALKDSQLVVHQPLYRELGGKALNLVIRLFTVHGIHDTQCGFKLFKGNAAYRIFDQCILNGWGFDVEVLYLARKMGYSVAEIPVRWAHAGASKIHPFQAGLQVLKDIARIRMHRYKI